MELKGTKDISEKEIRCLCGGTFGDGGMFLKDLWSNDMITFNDRNYRKDAIISIEIPEKSEHYETRTGREWLTPDMIQDYTIKSLIELQTAIDEYNKVKSFVGILNAAKKAGE